MWLESLTAEQASAVDALAARAAAADGFDPLNEEARLTRGGDGARHLIVEIGDRLAGYLVHSTEHDTAQIMVDPEHRRRGIGSSLAAALGRDTPLQLWAFRDAPPAQGFARSLGLVPGRTLLVLEKTLGQPAVAAEIPDQVRDDNSPPQDTPNQARDDNHHHQDTPNQARDDNPHHQDTPNQARDDSPPGDGVQLRSYTPADADALLALNAAAFADHPEQGSLDESGLAARLAEDWFDPDGLILATQDDRLLGFHWTKRHPDDVGEVYVIGVDPAAQGRGLGRRLLDAGLDHLSRVGCRRVILYVDSADTVAVQMYGSAGFTVAHRDVLYVPAAKERP